MGCHDEDDDVELEDKDDIKENVWIGERDMSNDKGQETEE